MVDDFNQGNQNRLDGYYNKFEKTPSSTIVSPALDIFRGESGKSLKINAKKGSKGFCGAWIHLFDFRAETPKFLDVDYYAYLSFWVKGDQGGEKFTVKLADKRWIGLEDSKTIGSIEQFLPGGVTQTWSEVLVPLSAARSLNLNELGGITFDFSYPGEHTIYIDDVAFKLGKPCKNSE